jgi:exosome complex component CSL4
MTTFVIPGQPLTAPSTGAALLAGPGTFSRGGSIYASLRGEVVKQGGVRRPAIGRLQESALIPCCLRQIVSVKGKDDAQTVPEPNSIVRLACIPLASTSALS